MPGSGGVGEVVDRRRLLNYHLDDGPQDAGPSIAAMPTSPAIGEEGHRHTVVLAEDREQLPANLPESRVLHQPSHDGRMRAQVVPHLHALRIMEASPVDQNQLPAVHDQR